MADEDEQYERLRRWADVIDDSSYYEILGVLELADEAAIKQAFHDLALAFHPDSHIGAPADVRECVQYIYRRAAEAYRALSDPALRGKYDLLLAKGQLRFGVKPSEAPGADGKPGVQTLEDVCSSPAAKLCARQADEHIARGELEQARAKLDEALAHDDYENPELEERIDALELAIYAMGQ